ncbi:MAG TPA: DUF1844 domain-containing protein [Pyrinomonadaceae bacterium]|jgi:hypothetical protein|nr:DUF1844 domain-containing protein [Pyrinomonadaceae bacterium]
MSEEKPTFKITDRRLFNADGSPREEIREEPAPAPPAPTADSGSILSDVSDARPAEPASKGATREAVEEAARAEGARDETASPSRAEREKDARGPAQGDAGASEEFLMLVEFLASFAADALGMVNHPAGGGGVNLQLAKQCIDMLGTLQRKTQGNLSGEESQFLDMILSQLRMQYVSLANAPRPPQGGRGFSGGDITGGR